MKQLSFYLLAISMLSIVSTGCKKSSDGAATNTTGDYIEFKIDGHLYRMDEQQIGPGNTDFIIGAANHQGPYFGRYSLLVTFGHSVGDEGVGLIVNSSLPITGPVYLLAGFNGDTFSYIVPGGNEYIISAASSGNVNFSKISTTFGDVVEGTFTVNKLDLNDENGDKISGGHTLTEGKFKTKIK